MKKALEKILAVEDSKRFLQLRTIEDHSQEYKKI